jgi:TatD DNase family protein
MTSGHAMAADGEPAAPHLLDAHCHLDFVPDPAAHARALGSLGVSALSCTVGPAGYEAAHAQLAGSTNVVVGLGLHPWDVSEAADPEVPLGRFCELVGGADLVGEVGLDLGCAHVATHDVQRAALDRAMDAVEAAGRRPVVSIHSVHAAGEVLDVLEATGVAASCRCVLHWFSGTSDELARAVRLGCSFSVGERMLATRKGRAYVHDLPAEAILLETDLPEAPDRPCSPERQQGSLAHALELVGRIRDEPMAQVVARNAERLLNR